MRSQKRPRRNLVGRDTHLKAPRPWQLCCQLDKLAERPANLLDSNAQWDIPGIVGFPLARTTQQGIPHRAAKPIDDSPMSQTFGCT